MTINVKPTVLLSEKQISNALAMAIAMYDHSKDFWFAYSHDVDINVTEDGHFLFVTAYKYDNNIKELITDQYQSLLIESIKARAE